MSDNDKALLERDPAWLKTASEAQLRHFLLLIDDMEDCPRKKFLLVAFNKECDRRMTEDYEQRANGEWI